MDYHSSRKYLTFINNTFLISICISEIVLHTLNSYGFGAYFNILPGSEWSAIMLTYGFPLTIIGMALKVNHFCYSFSSSSNFSSQFPWETIQMLFWCFILTYITFPSMQNSNLSHVWLTLMLKSWEKNVPLLSLSRLQRKNNHTNMTFSFILYYCCVISYKL